MVFIIPPPEIVELPEMTIIGLGGDYSLETRGEIPKLWWQLQAELPPLREGRRETTYGVFQSVPPGAPFDFYGRFSYTAGLAFDPARPVSKDFQTLALRGGRYAKFRFTGSYSEMTDAFDPLLLHWLPESEWQLDEREVIECYPSYEIGGRELPVFEIWLPVVPKT